MKATNEQKGNATTGDPGPTQTPPPATEGSDESVRTVTEPPLTPEQIAGLKAKAAKADENWDRLLRTTADLENTRKRAARDKQEAVRYANEGLLQKLVPVLDHLDMALAAVDNRDAASAASLKTGIEMVANQLKAVLQEAGLEGVDATRQVFDPKLHEAVSEQETSEVPEGHVLQQLRKGYKLRDRLLRPAGVVVARKPAA
jgi:molecular chaperone GrpE